MTPFSHLTVLRTGPAERYVLVDDNGEHVISMYAADPRGKERAEWLAATINGRIPVVGAEAVDCLTTLLQTIADDGQLEQLTTPEFRARCEAITGPIKRALFK
jgi:hypothetical protein